MDDTTAAIEIMTDLAQRMLDELTILAASINDRESGAADSPPGLIHRA